MHRVRPALAVMAAAVAGACVYDWTVPPKAGDEGAGASTTGADGSSTAQMGSSSGSGGTGAAGGGGGAGGDGGAGGQFECPPDAQDDSCEACAKAECCQELYDCAGDPSCSCWLECLLYGGDCTSRCGAPSSAAVELGVCMNTQCNTC